MPAQDFNDVAELIVRVHGTALALAALSGRPVELGLASDLLKKAIVDALEKAAKEKQCQNVA